MSLDNTPKTDWITSDGVANTDLNNIGKNLNELEDTKAELDDDVSFSSVTATTATTSSINNSGFTLIPPVADRAPTRSPSCLLPKLVSL